MKILLMSHTGLISGGAEQCLLEYVAVLINQGYDCKIIVPYRGDMSRVLSERSIPWVAIGYGWAIRPHRRVHPHRIMASTGNSLVRIFQEVEKYHPDIIICNTAVIPWGLYAGRAFRIPTLVLAHEVLSDKDPSLNVVPNYHEYGDIISKNADYIVYNSQFVRNEFASVISLPTTAQSVLYPLPPLDKDKIEYFYKENTIGNKIKIGIFGALSPRKNQLEALQAAKILHGKGIKNFSIDLYGDKAANPRYTKSLRQFIRNNSLNEAVTIKGYATNVFEKMNEYGVILSTSKNEPFGRTIIEGQLFGRIVITNDTGGGVELVRDLKTGLVYKSGNPDQLAEKILWIMNNKAQALALGYEAKTEQYKEYVTPARYDPLLDAVKYISKLKNEAGEVNIFDPMMDLFQYNHQLNNKYKHLYRLTHNRLTRPLKSIAARVLVKTKNTIRQLI